MYLNDINIIAYQNNIKNKDKKYKCVIDAHGSFSFFFS